MKEELSTVRVNGVLLHYALYGEGAPLLMVHGNGEDHHLFDGILPPLLEAGYRVYAPDSRGQGANAPLSELHYADMAEDMYGFIRALGLERPSFYGHSDGGIVGLMLELSHPGTLGRLAFSGVNLSPEGIDPAFIREYTRLNRLHPDPLVKLMLTEPHLDPARLRDIRIPVLCTVGERDLILPEETQRIVSNLPDVRCVVVPGADHGSYVQDSEQMGRMLRRFLEEGKESGSSGL